MIINKPYFVGYRIKGHTWPYSIRWYKTLSYSSDQYSIDYGKLGFYTKIWYDSEEYIFPLYSTNFMYNKFPNREALKFKEKFLGNE
jgi:hypothetical protein